MWYILLDIYYIFPLLFSYYILSLKESAEWWNLIFYTWKVRMAVIPWIFQITFSMDIFGRAIFESDRLFPNCYPIRSGS